MKKLSRIFHTTIFRYGLVGGAVSLLDVLIFNTLIYFSGTYYVYAAVISNTISFFIRFFLQKHIAFRSHSREEIKRELFQYGILFAVSIGLTALIIFIFVDLFNISASIAQIIAIIIVAAASFFIYRYVIFYQPKKAVRRILLITQKIDINDPVLGFFHRWTEEFAKKFDSIIVICLEKGDSNLPENVKVLSLGKEERQSRLQYLIHFFWYVIYERKNYDAVFVHMNQQYVILGALVWKFLNMKIFIWRNHSYGNFVTDLAVLICDGVFCTSRFSYTAKYKKTELMPVGIDIESFKRQKEITKIPRSILFLARISPIKKPDLLLSALKEIKNRGVDFTASFYGDALPKDESYQESLKSKLSEYNLSEQVHFYPGITNKQTVNVYNSHEIFVNLTISGSYDKTIFEAMACETMVMASNKDLQDIVKQDFIFKENDVLDLADHLEKLMNLSPEEKTMRGQELRKVVIEKHSLQELANRLDSKLK